jgi:hypothetical protein
MTIITRAVLALLFTFFSTSVSFAHGTDSHKDQRALDVLNKMAVYSASIGRFVITGQTHTDARFDVGLVISNPRESQLYVDRSGSLFVTSFDGIDTSEIYIHDGMLTVSGTKHNYYARTKAPEDLETALHFALDQFDVETPLMDFVFADAFSHLLEDQDTIIYLTDKSRIRGIDCHHIVVRGPEVDMQLWIEEGDKPVTRKIQITSILEKGSPRYYAFLDWNVQPDFDPGIFNFVAPEDSMEIKFIGTP